MTIPSILITGLRILLGAILFFAGIAKLSNFGSFVINVDSYQMLPIGFVKPISYLLVSAEITVGIVLIIGYFTKGASILAAVLFILFAFALTNVVWKEIPITDCGCSNFLFSLLDMLGFQISTIVNWKTVVVNAVLSVMSFGVAISPHQGFGLDSLMTKMRVNQ